MERDIFFLGAGFDKEYLQPLMRDFPDDFESLCSASPGFLKNHQFLTLVEQRLINEDYQLQKDLLIYFRHVKQFDSKMQQNVEDVIDFAHKNLANAEKEIFFCLFHYVLFLRELGFYRAKQSNKVEDPKLYELLLKRGHTIITTNYTAFIEKEHPNSKKWIEQTRLYEATITDPSYFGVSEELNRPAILKLHGGVVFYCNNANLTCVFTDEGKEFSPYIDFKAQRGALGEHKLPNTSSSQLIVPPFKNKDEFIQSNQKRFYFYKNIWENAKKELQAASRLFVIGYSFNNDDKNVEELLEIAKEKEVYIVGRTFNAKKVRKIFNNVKYINCTAREFIEAYVNGVIKTGKEIKC